MPSENSFGFRSGGTRCQTNVTREERADFTEILVRRLEKPGNLAQVSYSASKRAEGKTNMLYSYCITYISFPVSSEFGIIHSP